jgi:3-oxoacyl-[acyl-carrier-protein] synthase-3
MDGAEVLSFTLREVPAAIAALLDKAGLVQDDVDYFVLHQANRFMLDTLRKKIGVAPERMPLHLEHVGNTVSSTIPLALIGMREAGQLVAGKRLMLVGFGVGYSWAATILHL